MAYLIRRRRVEREAHAPQAERGARASAPGAHLGRGPSNTPPRVQTIAQKQAKEVSDDRHGSA